MDSVPKTAQQSAEGGECLQPPPCLPLFFLCSFSISSQDWDSQELWHDTLWLCPLGSLQWGFQTYRHQFPF